MSRGSAFVVTASLAGLIPMSSDPLYVLTKHADVLEALGVPLDRTGRVVVEPDVGNTAVHALNAAVGFTVAGPIDKPEKRALLGFCTRDQFLAATGLPDPARGDTP